MGAACQRLAGHGPGEAQASVRGEERILEGGLDTQVADRLAVRRGSGRRQRRRQIGVFQGAGEPGVDPSAAGQAAIEIREAPEIQATRDVGDGRGRLALEGRGEASALQTKMVEAVAVVRLRDASLKSGRAAQGAVRRGQSGDEPGGRHGEIGRQRLARGIAAEARLDLHATGQAAPGKSREYREVRQGCIHRAGQCVLADAAGVARPRRLGFQPQGGDVDHAVRPGGRPDGELCSAPEGPAQGGIGQSQTLDLAIRHDGEALRRRFTLRLHAEARLDVIQRRVPAAQVGRVEAAAYRRRRQRPLQAAVEHEPADLGLARARHRALGGQGAGLKRQIGDPILGQAAARREARRAGGQFQAVNPEGAAIREGQPALELGRAGEDGCRRARCQALDARREVQGEAPLGADAGDLRATLCPDVRPGGEVELGIPGIKGARAVEVEVDGRSAREIGRLREQPARRLDQVGLQFQAVARRHVEEREQEAPGGIKALRPRLQVEPLAGRAEPRPTLGREARGLPGDRLAEDEFGQLEALDLDLHGQVRQQLPVGLGLRRRRTGDRPAQHLDPPDLQAVHLQPSRQKREPAPDDAGPVELQPDAVAVAHRDVADRGVGGQRPVDRADRHAGRRRRQRARQESA